MFFLVSLIITGKELYVLEILSSSNTLQLINSVPLVAPRPESLEDRRLRRSNCVRPRRTEFAPVSQLTSRGPRYGGLDILKIRRGTLDRLPYV